jgi:hypothetical protein
MEAGTGASQHPDRGSWRDGETGTATSGAPERPGAFPSGPDPLNEVPEDPDLQGPHARRGLPRPLKS